MSRLENNDSVDTAYLQMSASLLYEVGLWSRLADNQLVPCAPWCLGFTLNA